MIGFAVASANEASSSDCGQSAADRRGSRLIPAQCRLTGHQLDGYFAWVEGVLKGWLCVMGTLLTGRSLRSLWPTCPAFPASLGRSE